MIYTLIKKDEENNIESIFSFDSVESFSESWSSVLPKTTVENGFPIADHINIENPSFDISATLSTYSIFNPENLIEWDADEEDFVLRGELGTTDIGHLVARENLKSLFLNRSLITLLETEYNSFSYDSQEQRFEELTQGYTNVYENCAIQALTFSFPERSNGVVNVSMKIEQLNIARVETRELSDEEMQKRVIPLQKDGINTGAADTTTAETKPDGKSVAEKPADKTAQKVKMPEGEQALLNDATAANEAAQHAVAATNGSQDLIFVNNKGGGVYQVVKQARLN